MTTPHRACRVCGERKPETSEFFCPAPSKTGKVYLSRRCRKCNAAATRDSWRNRENAQERDRASRAPRREQIRAYDRMRAKRDREKRRAIIARWVENNRDRYRALRVASSARRRARVKGATGSFTTADVAKLLVQQGHLCWWCRKKLAGKYHVDHRVPLAKQGTNDISNLVISCAPCNHSKSTKMPWEFAGRLF